MPLIDMPLEKLRQYQGCNPKPNDFEEYWQRAIAELDATPSEVELVAADYVHPAADCYDMYFTGVGGSRIYAKLLIPKNITNPAPASLHFHGYSGKSADWGRYIEYAAAGFVTAAMDARGQAGKSENIESVRGTTYKGQIIRGLSDHPDKLVFRNIFLDTAQLARIIMDMPEVDETRVGASGGSQGGALTIACAALEPRLCKAAPCYPFLCDYKRVWDMDLDMYAYEELRTYFRDFDPKHKKEDEIFTKLGYIDLQFLAPRIKADVLMFTGLMDEVCPPSTQFAAFNKMTCKKDVVIYPDFGHEALPEAPEDTFKFMAEML